MRITAALAFLLFASTAQAKDITVVFNEQEAQAIVQLMDLAVKSSGLQVAEAALVLTKKIQAAAQAPEPKKP